MRKDLSIVFMGTPEFSVPSLEALIQSPYNVALVVTQPDKPKGRGRVCVSPPVKQAANRFGLKIVQPHSIRTEAFVNQLTQAAPDFLIVVAFGQILTKPLLELPVFGAVNIHASLLPKYRGPAPIQWSIINREKETGVTSILMDTTLDTGDILLSLNTAIGPDETAAELHDRLALLGADLLIHTLNGMKDHAITPVPQDPKKVSHAPFLKKSDGRIDWSRPAEHIAALIRGVTPWPGAFTFHGRNRLKIFRTELVPLHIESSPGTVLHGFSGELRIATGSGVLSIVDIQSESGKRLPIDEFLRGYRIFPGDILT